MNNECRLYVCKFAHPRSETQTFNKLLKNSAVCGNKLTLLQIIGIVNIDLTSKQVKDKNLYTISQQCNKTVCDNCLS